MINAREKEGRARGGSRARLEKKGRRKRQKDSLGRTINEFCRMSDSFRIARGCRVCVGGHIDEARDIFSIISYSSADSEDVN